MGMEHGFSTPRSDAFPAGLRVLVVDDDPTWLKILEKMLKKCCYEVTTCGLAREALKLLRDRKDGFDIVISDVNMPDMDGFRLLEHVGLEMDLPVIMMSVDGETKRVMKGVQHGACDYLLKPIRMKELKNIWQHVVRKRMHDVIDIEYFEDRSDHSQNGHYGGDQNFLKKRKEVDNEKDTSDPSNSKKARVVWTVDLHKKFVEAVNQLGIDSDKIGPKKILDLMNVPWLTRENVASHLQKYRLYLSRLRKEDTMQSSCCGIKNQDHSPKDSSGSFSLQTSSFGLQNDITSKCFYQGNQLPVHTVDSEILDSNPESNMSLPLTENRITFSTKNCDSHTSRTSQLSFNHTYGSSDMSIKHASFDSPVSGRHPWRGEVADRLQFESDLKPHSNLENCFTQPTVPIMPQCINSDLLEPAPCVSPTPSISENNSISLIDIKPSNSKGGVNNTGELSPMKISLGSFSVSNTDAFGCVYDMKTPSFSHDVSSIKDEPLLEGSLQSFPVHLGSHLSETQGLEPIGFDATLEMKKQISYQGNIIGQSSVVGSESEPRNQGLGSESAYGLLSEDLMFRWLQYGDITRKDFGVDYIGFQGCYFPEFDFVTSLPPYEYVPKLDNECLHDWGDGGIFS